MIQIRTSTGIKVHLAELVLSEQTLCGIRIYSNFRPGVVSPSRVGPANCKTCLKVAEKKAERNKGDDNR